MLYVQNNNIKMDSFELNKIFAAILIVILLVFGLDAIVDRVFEVKKLENPAYKVDVEEKSMANTSETITDGEKFDVAALMSKGNLSDGEKVFKKCAACHSIKKDGRNKIGPALYNVVGRAVGGVSDYKYSKALASYGKNWTFEELNGFLIKPATYLKGTKMAYAGLKKETDRAK